MTPSKESLFGNLYILGGSSRGTILLYNVYGNPVNYYYSNGGGTLLKNYKIFNVIDYNGYLGPYSNEVQHGHYSDAPDLYEKRGLYNPTNGFVNYLD